MDLGVGDAAVVVDHRVDERCAHQDVTVRGVRCVWGPGAVPLALLASHVAPATTVGDVPELLHIDV